MVKWLAIYSVPHEYLRIAWYFLARGGSSKWAAIVDTVNNFVAEWRFPAKWRSPAQEMQRYIG